MTEKWASIAKRVFKWLELHIGVLENFPAQQYVMEAFLWEKLKDSLKTIEKFGNIPESNELLADVMQQRYKTQVHYMHQQYILHTEFVRAQQRAQHLHTRYVSNKLDVQYRI